MATVLIYRRHRYSSISIRLTHIEIERVLGARGLGQFLGRAHGIEEIVSRHVPSLAPAPPDVERARVRALVGRVVDRVVCCTGRAEGAEGRRRVKEGE